MALAKLYTEKTAITAADMLNDQVVPFYDAEHVPLLRILTDRGTEYCGTVERHNYQLYLAMEDIPSRDIAFGNTLLGSGPLQNQGQSPANKRHLRTLSSHHEKRILQHRVSQEDLRFTGAIANRRGSLAGKIQ